MQELAALFTCAAVAGEPVGQHYCEALVRVSAALGRPRMTDTERVDEIRLVIGAFATVNTPCEPAEA